MNYDVSEKNPEEKEIQTLIDKITILETFIDSFDKMVKAPHDLCR
jgi:hypothetical protein